MIETIPEIKKRLYAMRNGIVADTLRSAGSPYRVIFGLNLPQITEIAGEIPHTVEIAEELRGNADSREYQLLAPVIYPADKLSMEDAEIWVSETKSQEAADILCMKLLRHTPYALQLVERFMQSQSALERYAALRLLFYFLPIATEKAKTYATREFERDEPVTKAIAYSILDEIALLSDDD